MTRNRPDWCRGVMLALAFVSGFVSACTSARGAASATTAPARPVQAAKATEPEPPMRVVQAAGEAPVAPPLATTPPPAASEPAFLTQALTQASVDGERKGVPATLIFEGPPRPDDAARPAGAAQPPARPLALALADFLANRPDDAIRRLQSYAPRDQEIVMRLLPLLSAIDQGGLATEQPKPAQVQQFLETLSQIETELRPLAPLQLQRLAFCRDIRGFGLFTRTESNRFLPGESRWLYGELLNLVDRRLPDGSYSVRLRGMVELFGGDGKPVGPVDRMNTIANNSASPRQDYFVRMDFRVPPQLPPGHYTVRIRIDDQDTGRAAEAILPFQVVAKR